MNPIRNKNIILGVTGSIAAYKAADLASKLAQTGAKVECILTAAATKFIHPITFQSVTGQRAYTESDLWGTDAHVLHIGLAQKANLLVIAPASANTLAKLAHGIADNLLTVTALALRSGETPTPLLLAPAMDAGMYAHPATQENIRILEQRESFFIGPEEGHLASGLVAKGRMSEPGTILDKIRFILSRGQSLQGKHFIVTAGGTQEDIDPVRYITNRSSGKQGYALAQAALDVGADVTLISGPTHLTPPTGVKFVAIRSAVEIEQAVLSACRSADALLMAAAVADFRPANPSNQKIKKEKEAPYLELERTSDILTSINSYRQQTGFPKIVAGFAAETQDLLKNAQIKLKTKGLDLIIANDVSATDAGFGVDNNRVTLLWADGKKEEMPLSSKFEIAEIIIEKLAEILKISASN
ncbi:MAG: bifunctional phosphopantothenoylcysteine decarboxylase/phosphopantothenate--cysteine ligase CoaBC [Anaerolineales bacterium]|jgi:phosphopantothenoylcysteine decarboxylase/phosphopantothenate--cysteine ligase